MNETGGPCAIKAPMLFSHRPIKGPPNFMALFGKASPYPDTRRENRAVNRASAYLALDRTALPALPVVAGAARFEMGKNPPPENFC